MDIRNVWFYPKRTEDMHCPAENPTHPTCGTTPRSLWKPLGLEWSDCRVRILKHVMSKIIQVILSWLGHISSNLFLINLFLLLFACLFSAFLHPGKFDFRVNITSKVTEDEPWDLTTVPFEDISVHHVPCLNQSSSIDLLTRKYIEANVGLIVRSVSRARGAVLFSLQAPQKRSLEEFWSSYVNGSLAQTLSSILGDNSTFRTGLVCHITTWIPEDEYTLYSRVYQPFQGKSYRFWQA